MGTTRGIPWPDPTAPVNEVDLHIKALAESFANPAIHPWQSVAAGWSIPSGTDESVWIVGNVLLWLECNFSRTGATLTANASGDITATLIGTLLPAFRPVRTQMGTTMTRGNVGRWAVMVNELGEVYLISGPPTASITSGSVNNRLQGLVMLA